MTYPGIWSKWLFLWVFALVAGPVYAGFQDPVDVPALPSALASRTQLTAVAVAGKRLVAVGQRGHAVFSDDGGNTWVQGQVPVSIDLLAVHFPTPANGWAVGHGGVVINTRDGGQTWTRQLDGRQASQRILDYYAQAAAGNTLANANDFAERERKLVDIGGTQPFMGVYFENEQRGYVTGTFNRILRTEDGGKTWTPLMHRVENPRELHFINIAAGASGLYMVGEAGSVWKYIKETDEFVLKNVGYDGTLFGIAVGGKVLVAYGMRGNVFRSADDAQTWNRVAIGSNAGVSGGTLARNDEVVLVTLAGTAFVSTTNGQSFKPLPLPRPMSYSGVASLDGKSLALVGAEGVRQASLTEAQVLGSTAGAAPRDHGSN